MKPIRLGLLAVAWICAGLTVCGLFLPWARIDVQEPAALKRVRETMPLQGTVQGLAGMVQGVASDVSRVAVTITQGAKTVTGAIDLPSLKDIPREVSGAQIPQLANSEHAQLAVAIMELLTGKRQRVGAQSYAVYALPGIAVLCALILTILQRPSWVPWVVAGVCAVVAAAGFWKLLTTNTATLFLAVVIGPGLWLSLWAYAGLTAAAAAFGVTNVRR